MGEYKTPETNNEDFDPTFDIYSIVALAKRLNITLDDMKEMSFVSFFNIVMASVEENSNSAIIAKPNKISKIGVWGRSNLCLNCNGEEIRIGPRGYYEMSFDETLGLSSFGVLAENESDFPFLIDYEYILS